MLKRYGSALRADGQYGFVFVISKAAYDRISNDFAAPRYKYGLTEEKLKGSVSVWKRDKGWICCITAYSVGVNPKVELVVCMGMFGSTDDGMGMSTMLQEFGRAGRSGAPATVLLIARPESLDELGRRYATARCYREMVSGWLDGRARRCGFGDNPYLAYAGREGGVTV
ncbi:hypothetical protein DL768_006112 [Monosporascus sp. mg162]|nr:hypothetical protein DL768_006112 [Monosporascus sp. mg162]